MKEREGEIERHAMQFIATTYRRLCVTHNTGNPIHVYTTEVIQYVCVFLCSYYIVMIARANTGNPIHVYTTEVILYVCVFLCSYYIVVIARASPSPTRNSCLYCVCTGERESIERDKI